MNIKQFGIIFFAAIFYLHSPLAYAQTKDTACLIVKVTNHAFFDSMIEGAKKAAITNNIDLKTFWGESEVDITSPIDAIRKCINEKVNGILITPTDSKALEPHILDAKKAGIAVFALDTPFDPYGIADATFATNNFKAGRLIGEYAAARIGKEDKKNARIGLLDLTPANVPVDFLRNNGFLYGFGVDIGDPKINGDEKDSRIVGNEYSYANIEGGEKAMDALLQINRNINVVYGINDYAAIGAHKKLKQLGLEKDVVLVSVDGDCEGLKNVKNNVIGATAMQFPFVMASKGIEAVRTWIDKGLKPGSVSGLHFIDTGVHLVTDNPVQGIESISTDQAFQLWADVGNNCN